MSMIGFLRCSMFSLALGCVVGTSHAFTVPDLQRLLQAASMEAVSYYEVRESPWLDRPVESRGTMLSSPGMLEKRVQSPRQETWRLLPDRMEWSAPGSTGSKPIEFSAAPAVAMLAETLRHVVAGDLLALEKDYRVDLRGDDRSWSVRLEPLRPEFQRYLEYLNLNGKGARLQVIVIVERKGERTTTYLNP